jgi:hypothetical protein
MWIWLMALIAVSLCITMLNLEMILNPEIKPVSGCRLLGNAQSWNVGTIGHLYGGRSGLSARVWEP